MTCAVLDMSRIACKEELLSRLDVLSHPKGYGLTQSLADEAIVDFCARCPDPVGAWKLIAECLDHMTDEQLVDRALAMPVVDISTVPIAVVPIGHPTRETNEGTGQSRRF